MKIIPFHVFVYLPYYLCDKVNLRYDVLFQNEAIFTY